MQSLGERVLVCLHAPPTPHCSAPAAGGSLVSKKIWKVQGAGGLGGGGAGQEELPEGHTVQHLQSDTAQRTASADPSGPTCKRAGRHVDSTVLSGLLPVSWLMAPS